MRFRRDAPLDTGQVTDLRGSRMGGRGGVAIGGGGGRPRGPRPWALVLPPLQTGGLGLVGLVIWLLISLLSNGGGLGQLAPLDQETVGQGGQNGQVASPRDLSDCKTGQ